MKHSLFATTAMTALAALFIGSCAFAQDDLTRKPKQLDQGDTATEQTTPSKPAVKNRVGETDCLAGQDVNCPPKKQRLGAQPTETQMPKRAATEEATPAKRPKVGQKDVQEPIAPKATEDTTAARQKVGQQEVTEPGKRPKKPMTGAVAPEQLPAIDGGKAAAKTQTGQTQTGGAGGKVEVTGSLRVAPDKATRVRDTLFRTGERTNIDVSVNIGTTLPERVRPRPLPTTIVEIAPEYRGYDYVIIRDEIVIVEPGTRKVVEVLQQGGGQHARRAKGPQLSDAQRQTIREYARQQRIESVQTQVDLDNGASIPADVELTRLPETVITEVPEIGSYQFFVNSDRVVLVDPETREVVEVVE